MSQENDVKKRYQPNDASWHSSSFWKRAIYNLFFVEQQPQPRYQQSRNANPNAYSRSINWVSILAGACIMFLLGLAGSLAALFASWKKRRELQSTLINVARKHATEVDKLQRNLRQKTDYLHATVSELYHYIDVTKYAIQHNITLKQTRYYLEAYLVERREEIRSIYHERTLVEDRLEKAHERIKTLEGDVALRDVNIAYLQYDLSKAHEYIQNLEQYLTQMKLYHEEKEKEAKYLKDMLDQAHENQQVLEYVLGRFAPELARKVYQALYLHRDQRKQSESLQELDGYRHIEESVRMVEQTSPAPIASSLEQQPQIEPALSVAQPAQPAIEQGSVSEPASAAVSSAVPIFEHAED